MDCGTFSRYDMMKKIWRILSYIIVATLASVVSVALCNMEPLYQWSKLDQLAAIIESQFIGEADMKKAKDAAATAMVYSLGDRWSYYLSAEEYIAHLEQMNNAYVGIGITITAMEDGSGVEVLKVEPNGPAADAGIQVGDVIVGVEGQDAAGMDTTEMRNLVRGKEGTFVQLTVNRGGEVFDLSVERRKVETAVATGVMLEGNVGLVTITNFDSRCASESIAAIEDLIAQGAQALVFDVRNNPGGYKDELVKLLDYLLPEGDLFHSEDYSGKVEVDVSDAKCLEMPMAVVVNEDSYSAAEFFAAALNEYDWATVVGTQTVGKGYFQVTYMLNDGSAVGLSIGKYTTPMGVSLQEVGITPELVVDVDDETYFMIYAGMLAPEEDPQIQAAVTAILP